MAESNRGVLKKNHSNEEGVATLKRLLALLKATLNNEPAPMLDDEVIKEAMDQSVLSLICNTTQTSLHIITNNVQLMWEQQQLGEKLKGIPYLVIKGSCAAMYYPDPLRRTLGDIDLLIKPEYFDQAYRALIEAGYKSMEPMEGTDRHVHLYRGKVIIELHRRFATLQTSEQEKMLDGWLYDAVPVIGCVGKYNFPMPEGQLNGLVLLTHINQHLEEGLGLRHLVDWIMYVRHSLPDSEWPEFQKKTDLLGLTKLAKVIAKLGQMYLGLSADITWCADVSEKTIEDLLEYVYECGNFGHKDPINNTIVMVLSHGRGVNGFFRNLQHRGEKNWEMLEKRPYLKSVAWAYQLTRYVKIGLESGGLKYFVSNAKKSTRRNRLMDELGATRLAMRE